VKENIPAKFQNRVKLNNKEKKRREEEQKDTQRRKNEDRKKNFRFSEKKNRPMF